MLVRMPVEVLDMVMRELSKADLKSLSLTSRLLCGIVTKQLWQVIRIHPQEHKIDDPAIDNFPSKLLNYVSELHIGSGFDIHPWARCPHHRDERANIDAEFGDGREFERLTQRTIWLLDKIERGALHNFSWDAGSCVPAEIMGPHGVLSRKHPEIQSLRFSTDQTCNHQSPNERPDLSAFRQLQHLYWRCPTAHDVQILANIMNTNSSDLKTLELNFVDSFSLLNDLGLQEAELSVRLRYFWEQIVDLNRQAMEPPFQSLQLLTLCEVPLTPEVVLLVRWETLRSLTIRHCPGWETFLDAAIQAELPVQLKTLEIQTGDREQEKLGSIVDFLSVFEGLQELFLGTPVFDMAFLLWIRIAQHQATLKRLVIHHRDLEDEDSQDEEGDIDIPRMGLTENDHFALHERRIENPIHGLELECLGLSCAPEFLTPILDTIKNRSSLKLLHIRQSDRDLIFCPCWAIDRNTQVSDTGDLPDMLECAYVAEEHESLRSDILLPSLDRLHDDFRSFAEWAFSPQGLISLKYLVYGDFTTRDCDQEGSAWVNRVGRNNLFLCRNADKAANFELFHEEDACWKDLVEEYRDILQPCPSKLQMMMHE